MPKLTQIFKDWHEKWRLEHDDETSASEDEAEREKEEPTGGPMAPAIKQVNGTTTIPNSVPVKSDNKSDKSDSFDSSDSLFSMNNQMDVSHAIKLHFRLCGGMSDWLYEAILTETEKRPRKFSRPF